MLKLTAALAAAIAILQAKTPPAVRTPPPAYDVILRHGSILDGTGSPRYRADLAIAGGSIARIGDLTGERARVDIDVSGLYVTPGFINIHSHATADGLVRAQNMLIQGVTTEIVNADGSGPVDIGDELTRLTDHGVAVNVGAQIGFNSVWSEVMGPTNHRPTA